MAARAFYSGPALDSDANDTSVAAAAAVSADARSTCSAAFWTLSRRRRSSERLVDRRTSSSGSWRGAGAAAQRSTDAAVDARMSSSCRSCGWPYSTSGRCLNWAAHRCRCPRTSS